MHSGTPGHGHMSKIKVFGWSVVLYTSKGTRDVVVEFENISGDGIHGIMLKVLGRWFIFYVDRESPIEKSW